MNLLFFIGIIDFKTFQLAFRKDRITIGIDNVAFKSPHHHLLQLLLIRHDRFGESLVVKKFQQRSKRLLIAIVRSCRQKEMVGEVRSKPLNYLRPLARQRISSGSSRSHVVGLVNDQYVEFSRICYLRRQDIF